MTIKKTLLFHLSDVHVWRDIPAGVRLASRLKDFKRYQGYANLKYRRGTNRYPPDQFKRILQDILAFDKNHHLIISGDITNLSMIHEFEAAKQILTDHYIHPMNITGKEQEYLTIVPGNHDTYVCFFFFFTARFLKLLKNNSLKPILVKRCP